MTDQVNSFLCSNELAEYFSTTSIAKKTAIIHIKAAQSLNFDLSRS
jgi:hypothetical protein